MNQAQENKKRKRRIGDRADGRRLRTVSPMSRVACYIMEKRNESTNEIKDLIDMEKIDEYVREKHAKGMKNFNLMHVIIAAYTRCVSQMPGLNRFIAGQEIYARNSFVISLTIKKEMKLESPDTVVKLHTTTDATAEDIYFALQKIIDDYRAQPSGGFDSTAKWFSCLPGFLLRFAVRTIRFFDYLGFIPKMIEEVSPFHCSMFITSMGSLGIPAIYHHLYDFGNCPVFMSFGAKQHKYETAPDGSVKHRSMFDFAVVMDERTVDGYYYAAALKFMKRVFKNPWVLDNPPEQVLEDID